GARLRGSALQGVQTLDGLDVEGINTQPIEGFRGKRDDAAPPDHVASLLEGGLGDAVALDRRSHTCGIIPWLAASPFDQRACADIGTVVHALEADPAHALIRPLARDRDGVPETGDPQHPTAGGHDAAGCARGPGMEDEEIALPIRLCE